MLSAVVFIFCTASAVLGQDMAKLNRLNALLSQVNYLPRFQIENNQPQLLSGTTTQTDENCPANKVLHKIEVILLKVLNDEYDRNLASNHGANINTLTSGGDKLILPLSKINSLKDLLENNNLQKKLRTKVTVKYELPSIEDLNCRQALTQILEVLREAKLTHEYYRTCGPKDKCPADNVADIKSTGDNNILNTAINQGNNYVPSKLPTLEAEQGAPAKVNDASESNQDVNNFMKYLLSNKSKEIVALLKNYGTTDEISLLNNTLSKELMEKLNFQSDSISDVIKNLPYNNKFTLQEIGNPSIDTPKNANLSDIIAQALLEQARNPVKVDLNVVKKPDSLEGTATNNVISLFPFENGKNIEAYGSNGRNININIDTGESDNKVLGSNTDIQNQQIFTKNVIGSISDDLNGNAPNVSKSNVLSVLETVKPGADYNELVSSMMKYQLNNQQIPLQQSTGVKYQGSRPFYVNGNLLMNGGKYLSPNTHPAGSLYQPPYQIGSSYRYQQYPYRYPNLNLLDNNQKYLNNQNVVYQTSYVKSNPFSVKPKLINNVNQIGQQLYAPYNLLNSQRLPSVTDQSKLNLVTDNNGIVELTYMLKQPNPVVYQPVYFVKYRLSYDSFVNNLKELLIKKPHLRADPAKLYQELIAVSNLAEVSPSLKGVGKEKLTQMVTTNGALVNTKVLKVNETLLSKQLETIQNLNSILAPSEIVNVTYSAQVNANKQAEDLEKLKVRSGVTDSKEIDIKYLENILNQDKSLGKEMDVVTTERPYNKPVQDYVSPNIPKLR